LQPKIVQALHNQLPFITALEFNLDRNILLIGNKTGIVISYELDNYNYSEKILNAGTISINMKKKLEIKTDPNLKITAMKVTGKNEILISLSNGSIAIYSHETENPECIF
jgi:hypothetical protein